MTNDNAQLNVKPRRNPHVLDMKQESQQHFDRQPDHGEKEDHHDRVLQQAHPLVVPWVRAAEVRVQEKSS
jgi:hypothetical protein